MPSLIRLLIDIYLYIATYLTSIHKYQQIHISHIYVYSDLIKRSKRGRVAIFIGLACLLSDCCQGSIPLDLFGIIFSYGGLPKEYSLAAPYFRDFLKSREYGNLKKKPGRQKTFSSLGI